MGSSSNNVGINEFSPEYSNVRDDLPRGTLRFPQPIHYERDSTKSKRSSVRSDSNRSDSVNRSTSTVYANHYTPNRHNEGSSLNYEMISNNQANRGSPARPSTSIFTQIKEISDNFFSKTSEFIYSKLSSRQGCSCEIGLRSESTCRTVMAWFRKAYINAELEQFKRSYEELSKQKLEGIEESFS